MNALVEEWLNDPNGRVVHVEEVAAAGALFADLDPPLPAPLTERLAAQDIGRLYRHQAHAIESIRSGTNTVIVAGTASG